MDVTAEYNILEMGNYPRIKHFQYFDYALNYCQKEDATYDDVFLFYVEKGYITAAVFLRGCPNIMMHHFQPYIELSHVSAASME